MFAFLGLVLACTWGEAALAQCEPEPVDETPAESAGPSASSVRLNELFPAPSAGAEFIELEILDDGGGDLHGWSVRDESGKTFVFDRSALTTTADRFFVLTDDISALALNNTGDTVDLLNPDGVLADTVMYETAQSDQSWSRFGEEWIWASPSAGLVNVESAEPDEEESENEDEPEEGDAEDEVEPEVTGPVVSDLRLSELLPNPEGNDSTDEWIELFNAGDAGSVVGWTLTDESDTYVFGDQQLEDEEWLVVSIEDSGINLNNTGDILYLIDPAGVIVQGVEYGEAVSGQSFAYIGETWEWTDQLTPGGENVGMVSAEPEEEAEETAETSEEEQDTALIPLADARSLEVGTQVVVQGVVSVEPGPLGSQILYIQDDSAGMQIYSSRKDFPADLMRGSVVEVTGSMSSAYGEVRVNAQEAGIVVLSQSDEVLPQGVEDLSAELVGQLVVVDSVVSQKNSTSLELESGVYVYVKSSTDISLSDIEAGQSVSVVGIVNQYEDILRLLPRSQDDIQAQETVTSLTPSAAAAGIPGHDTGGPVSSLPTTNTRKSVPGWFVISIAGSVIVLGGVHKWVKSKQIAKRMFGSYSTPHGDAPNPHPHQSAGSQAGSAGIGDRIAR